MNCSEQQLSHQQVEALASVTSWVDRGRDETSVFLLCGSAGTGKTTLVSALVGKLMAKKRSFALLAPTGRAARILGSRAGQLTSTIHAAIYSLEDVEVFELAESRNDPGMRVHFRLKTDDPGETLFIVDEASMVADVETEQDLLRFGSGRLPKDLIAFTRIARPGRTGSGPKLMFVGDPAQLPPVGQTLSPALSRDYLQKTFGLMCTGFELTEVIRQKAGGAILNRATFLRDRIGSKVFNTFDLSSSDDEVVAGTLADGVALVTEAQRSTTGSAVLITHSNARAMDLNRAVRWRLWDDEKAPLRSGDLLIINRNAIRYGLYNGDLARAVEVTAAAELRSVRIRGVAEPVHLTFRRATVAYPAADAPFVRIDCVLLENLLQSPERELSPLEQRALLVDFRQRSPHLKPRTAEFRMALLNDSYFNALQVKYGYALTCHKAQGGEWDTAVVQFGDGRGTRTEEFYRWTYTAITRAKTRLVTIDAPKFDAYSGMDWGGAAPTASTSAMPSPSASIVCPPPGDDLRADTDWARFSFGAGDEALFSYHQRLRDAWAGLGIEVDRLDHLQYCERYRLKRDGNRAGVSYWYKGHRRVSRVESAPGQVGDPEVTESALAEMRKILVDHSGQPYDPQESDFVRAFRERVESALVDTGIRVVSRRIIQYGLRIEFEAGGLRAEIDFFYDETPNWTAVREVGGPGASHGLIDRLRPFLGG